MPDAPHTAGSPPDTDTDTDTAPTAPPALMRLRLQESWLRRWLWLLGPFAPYVADALDAHHLLDDSEAAPWDDDTAPHGRMSLAARIGALLMEADTRAHDTARTRAVLAAVRDHAAHLAEELNHRDHEIALLRRDPDAAPEGWMPVADGGWFIAHDGLEGRIFPVFLGRGPVQWSWLIRPAVFSELPGMPPLPGAARDPWPTGTAARSLENAPQHSLRDTFTAADADFWDAHNALQAAYAVQGAGGVQ